MHGGVARPLEQSVVRGVEREAVDVEVAGGTYESESGEDD